MNFNDINFNHPIVYGLIAGIITYIICLLDVRFENNKMRAKSTISNDQCKCPELKVSLKLPFLIGGLVWLATTYLSNIMQNDENVISVVSVMSPNMEGDLEMDLNGIDSIGQEQFQNFSNLTDGIDIRSLDNFGIN